MKRICLILVLLICSVNLSFAEQYWTGSVYNDSVGGFVQNIQTFDWSASGSGNMQGLGGVPTAPVPGTVHTFRYQSYLFAVTDANGGRVPFPGLNSGFEYTLVMEMPLQVSLYDATNKLTVFKTLAGGKFYIYHDAQPNINVAAGYGFDDGDLVASGDILQDQLIVYTQATPTLGVGSAVLNCNVTTANSSFLNPAPPIISFRYEGTVNYPPLESTTTKYFDGRDGQGNLNVFTVTSRDAAFKCDGSSKFLERACSGTIGDFVWHDQNSNGIQDPGEEGIANVTLNLLDAAGNLLKTTTTGPDGAYLFNGLCAGTYSVDVVEATLPSGVSPTIMMAGSDPAVDSNGDSVGNPVTVTLPTDNSSDVTIDFGYVTTCSGSIGDLVWYDLNRNGIQDNGEPGIQNVSVILKDAAGSDPPLATTTTDVNGLYTFSGLCAGTYTVEAATPSGYSPTVALVGTDRAVDSNENPTLVTLPTNDTSDTTIDFGFVTPCTGTIGDLVWHDLNRDGIQDGGEPGFDNVTVSLLKAPDAPPIATTTTVAGYYQFSGLCAGDYTVVVNESTLPPGYTPTASNVGADRSVDSNGTPSAVNLPTDNSTDQTIDFGYISPCTGAIGDYVWHDSDRDGIQDEGEPGISGVTVNLLNAVGAQIATTSTGVGGLYLFTGLCPGTYTVSVDASTLPAGYTPTIPNAAGSDMTNDSNGSPAEVVLAEGEQNRTIDFGYVNPCTGSLGDFVWQDLDRDGVQDVGEPGIDGVTVNLQNAVGTIIATTTTGPGPMILRGYYQFAGLCAGNYTVVVESSTLPPGYTATVPNVGDPTLDSNGSPAAVNLPTDNSSDQTIDFGYLSPACDGSIGDFVWNDANKNGIQDAGEQGMSGVVVFLKNPLDHTTYATTTTDANGFYLFAGLCGGCYKVMVDESTLPAGFVPTLSEAGTNLAIDSNGSPTFLTLPNDFDDLTIDFGYYMATGTDCTLTWGYWKTHSEFGPAPYDDAWALLPSGASTPFFISGKTWYQVLQTDSRGGSAYYILAHQYIAAYLNLLNGADTSVVNSQLAQAEALFNLYKPTDCLSYSVRKTFISLAYTLDQYNNGNIGPGHCKDTNTHHHCKDTHHKHESDGHCIIIPKKCDDRGHAHDKGGHCIIPQRSSGGCNDKGHPHDRNGKCIISHRKR